MLRFVVSEKLVALRRGGSTSGILRPAHAKTLAPVSRRGLWLCQTGSGTCRNTKQLSSNARLYA